MTLQGHRHVFVVDLAFHETIHRAQKILAVIASMKAENVRCQHVQQDVAFPGTHTEGFSIGSGNMPEQGDGGLGFALAQ